MVASAAVALAAATAVAFAAERPWRVVVLNGSDPTLPAFVAIDRAMRDRLAAPGAHPVELYVETFDVMRFPSAQIEPSMLDLLRSKYARLPMDAVIAIGDGALDFTRRHGEELWPASFVLFHHVPEHALRSHALPARTTGIVTRFPVASTAEFALRLRPSTRKLIVIGGSGEFDKSMIALSRASLAGLAPKVEIEYWVDRGFDELVGRVVRLPEDSTVLLLSFFRDANGRVFTPRDALAQLAAVSKAPIFGLFDTYVGSGIVGGYVDDYALLGRSVAELLLETLARPADDRPPGPRVLPPLCVVDARQMRRWNVSESLLPEGCTIRFEEISVWSRYRWQIILGVAIIASQSLLIAALILQRRRRRLAEISTSAARAELTHAVRLASMGELTASIAHEIKQPLSAILAHADTAELLLDSDAPPLAEIQQIIARIRHDDLRANDVISHLRDLLGKHTMEHKRVDVNEVVTDTLLVLDAEAHRRGVAVEIDLAPDLAPVAGDRVHLQQVVLNLVLNAFDALTSMSESDRRVVVRTVAAAGGVEISVADSGQGIDPALASRLFDSFVTTKAGGLGLGLSIARSIVQAHGGAIEASTKSAGGAIFRVRLPAAKPDASQA